MNELLRRMLFLPPQSSTVAREIDYLHYFVILTTMAGAAAIAVVGAAFAVRYRARGDTFRREDPAARPPLWAEAGVIGGLLSLFCLWWVIGFCQFVKVQVPPANALRVYVTAKQWMWKFAYPEGEHTIATLYVPTGRPIELFLTSRDVIHSFYVPDFRIKQDAVPGRYTTSWFEVTAPGAHMVLCAEYCGTGHSTMRAQVIGLAPEDYARWLGAARRGADSGAPRLVAGPPPGVPTEVSGAIVGPHGDAPLSVEEFVPAQPLDLVRVGRETAAELGCARCHTLDGSPFIGPTWAGLYRAVVPLQGGASQIADEAYLTESMMDPAVKVHAGFQPVMPTYQGRITPGQVAAIIELIKSIRDVPGRGAVRAPAPPPPAAAPLGAERAGDMESARVEIAPARQTGVRPIGAAPGLTPPPDQQGLPPPGLVPNPLPRLPVLIASPDGGAPKEIP